MERISSRRAVVLLVTLVATVPGPFGCNIQDPAGGGGGGGVPDANEPPFVLDFEVVDEDGAPLPTAVYSLGEDGAGGPAPASPVAVDAQGRFRLAGLTQPCLVTVEASGHLPEPLVACRRQEGALQRVRLFRRLGAGGARRLAIHFGGDVMLGRRYLSPTSDQTAVVVRGDSGASARQVVAAVAPLYRASDVRSLNLETVVGELPTSAAYPKKRFLLQSPPEVVSLLEALDASFVTLGNNHARDWLDAGVESTLVFLDAAGLPHVGAAPTEAEARTPVLIDSNGLRVGCLSYTSVNGDFVNDNLPRDADPTPQPLKASESWQYQRRYFQYEDGFTSILLAARRIGEIWSLFRAAEALLEPGAQALASLWAATVEVYPELQDWVARRGHGGANPFDAGALSADIAALRSGGADIVIVQFHSGYQFVDVKSEFLEGAAHQAIDEGADLVVCHHPHVLQGLEWYKGKLIAYSLGNFVFDQDFLSTFPSVILRVVLEESDVIEARALPIVLDRYRPVPLGGRAASRVIQMLAERSILPLRSERIGGGVRQVLRDADPASMLANFTLDGASARVGAGPPETSAVVLQMGEGAVVSLAPPALTRSRAPGGGGLDGVLLGRDIFGWGDFEDHGADGESRGGTHWLATTADKRVVVLPSAPSGVRCLQLRRRSTNRSRVLVRPVARIPMPRHRAYEDTDAGVLPIDGEASYSLRLKAKLSGSGTPFVRLDFYHFDDTNPTEDPESVIARTRELSLEVVNDGEWHEVVADLPPEFYSDAGELEVNAVLLNVGLAPPKSGECSWLVDDLELIEWRRAPDLPDAYYAMDALRVESGAGAVVTLEQILGE